MPGVNTATLTLADLSTRLGHDFADPELLLLALTHRSWCAENPGSESNERLEFLGDAVLGVVVTDHIFAAYPELPEGGLAKLRAGVVSARSLAGAAAGVALGDGLRLGRGEDGSGGRAKQSILADALEAVIGAVYLDGGMAAASRLVLDLLSDAIDEAASGPGGEDHKTLLQEVVARRFEALPDYRLHDEGPDHEKRFFARVAVRGRVIGTGEGRSKKDAEQAAARAALGHLAVVGDDAALRHQGPVVDLTGVSPDGPGAAESEGGGGDA